MCSKEKEGFASWNTSSSSRTTTFHRCLPGFQTRPIDSRTQFVIRNTSALSRASTVGTTISATQTEGAEYINFIVLVLIFIFFPFPVFFLCPVPLTFVSSDVPAERACGDASQRRCWQFSNTRCRRNYSPALNFEFQFYPHHYSLPFHSLKGFSQAYFYLLLFILRTPLLFPPQFLHTRHVLYGMIKKVQEEFLSVIFRKPRCPSYCRHSFDIEDIRTRRDERGGERKTV